MTAPAYFRKASVPAIGKLTDDPEAVAKCTKAFTGRELYSEAMFVGEPPQRDKSIWYAGSGFWLSNRARESLH